MGQMYWIIEYAKVLLAYGFVLYLWPLVVFERHLRTRSRTYRFGFCATVPVMIANTAVLLLGLVHALRPWVTSLLFWGVFLWCLLRNHRPLRSMGRDVASLNRETMTARRFLVRARDRIRSGVKTWAAPVWENARSHRWEYALLLVLLVFGTIYFSYGAFDEHSYGFGDQYVHHQWIHGLTEGKAFYNGIYPEAMHCVIYLTCTAFRIRLYSGVLFFAGVHVHVLLVSAYLFMKEVFHWRYAPLAALAMFLTFDQLCIDEVFGMSRLSWTLPMEYALYTTFLSAVFLIRFLKRVMRGHAVTLHPLKPRKWGVLHDEDLFLFAMAVAASLAIHFYVTISAVFFCLVIALVYLWQVFRKGSFLPLAAAVVIAFGAAVAPMGAAFALGYPLQGSLYWAMRVIKQGESNSEIVNYVPPEETAPAETSPAETPPADGAPSDGGESVSAPAEEITGEAPAPAPPQPLSQRLLVLAKGKALALYGDGYATLYPGVRSTAILLATAFALATALPAHFILRRRDRRRRGRREKTALPDSRLVQARQAEGTKTPRLLGDLLDGVLITALLSVVLMILYAAKALGLPELVAGSRLCSTEQILMVMLYCVPLDYVMGALSGRMGRGWSRAVGWAAVAGVYVFAQFFGIFHSYPYFELTRYNAAVETTNHIIDTLPRRSYTVISTTDELYQVIREGYHEELLQFLQRQQDPSYTIPTPYLLLYIEKHPIRYAQYHFAAGPRWLARQEYVKFYPETGSQCPDILQGQISTAEADADIRYGAKLSDTASTLEGRTVLESKAYQWYRTFSAMHPHDCRVVYEDDDFLCCCITQNPGCLYTLGILGTEE